MRIKVKYLRFPGIFLVLLTAVAVMAAEDPAPGSWRVDFSDCRTVNHIPVKWEFQAGKPFVNDTAFAVETNGDKERVLTVRTDSSTGMLVVIADGDLKRCPILRWKWRAKNLPPRADSRVEERDDQSVAIYLGAGKLHRKSVSYRWDTETPIGTEGLLKYAAGLVANFYRTLCNQQTPLNEWRVEEVDVAADFKKQYGYLPKPGEYIIGVAANSQYTKSQTYAEVAWIELVPRSEKK